MVSAVRQEKRRKRRTVEHVHIYKGGQAIVGPVSQDKSGGPRRSDEEQD